MLHRVKYVPLRPVPSLREACISATYLVILLREWKYVSVSLISPQKEIYSKPYQPPPDSEMAVYSHLKHRGYRKINRTNVEVGGEIGSG